MAPEWIKACEVKELNNSELVGFDFNEKKILISMIRNKAYEDGTPQNLPAEVSLKTYKTKIENNSVYILVE